MKRNAEQNRVSVVIPAAGSSSRMGMGMNKQFLMLEDIPVLAHTLMVFDRVEEVSEVIVVTRADDILLVQDMVRDYNIGKVKAILPGGKTRQESVYYGLSQAGEEKVLIHDGARPFVKGAEVRMVIEALNRFRAVALGVPVKDTIKKINSDGIILETPSRENLVQIQTPQAFYTGEILEAHKKATADGLEVTDDCALAEYVGISVKVIEGSYRNIKITTPEDIILAKAFKKAEEEMI